MSKLYHSIKVSFRSIFTPIKKRCSSILIDNRFTIILACRQSWQIYFVCRLLTLVCNLQSRKNNRSPRKQRFHFERNAWTCYSHAWRTFLSFCSPVANLSTKGLLNFLIILGLLLLLPAGLLFVVCLLICSISMSLLLLSEQVNSILPPIRLSLPVKTRRLSSRLRQTVSESFSTKSGKEQSKERKRV